MVFAQCLVTSLFILQWFVAYWYYLATRYQPKSAEQWAIIYFVLELTNDLYYMINVKSFYMSTLTSRLFRTTFINAFCASRLGMASDNRILERVVAFASTTGVRTLFEELSFCSRWRDRPFLFVDSGFCDEKPTMRKSHRFIQYYSTFAKYNFDHSVSHEQPFRPFDFHRSLIFLIHGQQGRLKLVDGHLRSSTVDRDAYLVDLFDRRPPVVEETVEEIFREIIVDNIEFEALQTGHDRV